MRYVKQVKVFLGTDSQELSKNVNEFLSEREYADILEIKGIDTSGKTGIGVLVVYREIGKT